MSSASERLTADPRPAGIREEIRRTLRLAWPVVLTQLGMTAMGLIDTLMVGRLGGVPLAAVGIGNAVYMTVTLFLTGILVALDPMVSQNYGAGKLDRCGDALWNGIWIALALGLPSTCFLLLGSEWLLRLLGQPPEVAQAGAAFLAGRGYALLPFLLFAALRGFLNGMGHVRPLMVIALGANAVHVLASWTLIFGHFGVPALGVVGAGFSAAVSRWLMVIALALLVFGPTYRSLGVGPRWPRAEGVRRILRLGLPIGAQIAAEVGVFSAASVFMGWIGPAAQGAHQIALQLASFTFNVPLGVGMAASIRVGQAIGRGDRDSASRAGRVALLLGTAFMACSACTFIAFAGPLAWAITPDDAAVAAVSIVLIRIAGAFQISDGVQAIGAGCLRGAADTRRPFLVNVFSHWCVGLPLGYLLAFPGGLGAAGLWFGLTAGLTLVAVLLAWRFLSGAWKDRASLVAG